jgi:hypothetical protein
MFLILCLGRHRLAANKVPKKSMHVILYIQNNIITACQWGPSDQELPDHERQSRMPGIGEYKLLR